MMKPIYVTKPSLPPIEEFQDYLKMIWESEYITNSGPFHQKLEEDLAQYLGVKYISVFSNGTLALITALQALNITEEVITTPYSFVATTNSLIWNRITPVFADINPNDCNINLNQIEAAITEKTTALMPVHVYGVPCDVEGIEALAKKHNLKVIYDAAHAFGVKYKEQSVLNYGDLSILSFHATKVFNTIEGGAIISHTKEMKTKIDNLKNFGIIDELTVVDSGI
ncbi:MAG: aminotransferase class I/II-fold pyridoxal phosphate-dependent enzyme, partial [Vicingus serpentipes]|nr:aminotransferase class I/II-fold pyridoxal phosphate-dependent enzyme [Vicingus serpentipes]